jgi:hypothetical protein
MFSWTVKVRHSVTLLVKGVFAHRYYSQGVTQAMEIALGQGPVALVPAKPMVRGVRGNRFPSLTLTPATLPSSAVARLQERATDPSLSSGCP